MQGHGATLSQLRTIIHQLLTLSPKNVGMFLLIPRSYTSKLLFLYYHWEISYIVVIAWSESSLWELEMNTCLYFSSARWDNHLLSIGAGISVWCNQLFLHPYSCANTQGSSRMWQIWYLPCGTEFYVINCSRLGTATKPCNLFSAGVFHSHSLQQQCWDFRQDSTLSTPFLSRSWVTGYCSSDCCILRAIYRSIPTNYYLTFGQSACFIHNCLSCPNRQPKDGTRFSDYEWSLKKAEFLNTLLSLIFKISHKMLQIETLYLFTICVQNWQEFTCLSQTDC